MNIEKPVLIFDKWEYVFDRWVYTLEFMDEEEIEGLESLAPQEEIDDYLGLFYERT